MNSKLISLFCVLIISLNVNSLCWKRSYGRTAGVPLFDFIIYPFFAKFGLFKRQLQRMSAGLFFAIFAFLIAAFLGIYLK